MHTPCTPHAHPPRGIRVPYLDRSGTEIAVRLRLALEGPDRFRWKTGSKPSVYGLWRLVGGDDIVLCEGESDCHTLWFHGIEAMGIPGAANWREDRDAAHLAPYKRVFVIVEPDKGGVSVKRWLANSAIRDRAWLVTLPEKDPSALHLSDQENFGTRFQAALDSSVSWTEYDHRQRNQEAFEAWDECRSLATAPDILSLFVDSFRLCGVVGEDRTGKLLYLILTSRLLGRPVSGVLKGPSSAGKSHITDKVLFFFPPDAYYALSSMSERSLAYSEEPISHRFLVLYEAAGLKSDFASYLIRSLLSEGRLRYETVEKTKDGMRPKLIERMGPTGLLLTTTNIKLHPENETRLLSIPIKDSCEQTKAILAALADESNGHVTLGPWRALQAWLSHSEHRVTIPYATVLAGLIPPVAVRLRRDFSALLALVRTHAILHQATRNKDKDGKIIATTRDYGAVRDLVGNLIAEGIEATVPQVIRETVRAADKGNSVSVAEVAKTLKIDRSAATRRLHAAEDRGFVKNLETKRGCPSRWVVDDPLPEDLNVLPSREEIEKGVQGVQGCAKGLAHPKRNNDAGFGAGVQVCTANGRDIHPIIREACDGVIDPGQFAANLSIEDLADIEGGRVSVEYLRCAAESMARRLF
ncbi:MAG: hypothetical protein ACREX9_01805 [Gammaproteobacteria bacterium]